MFGDMDIRAIGVEKASGQAGGTGCASDCAPYYC